MKLLFALFLSTNIFSYEWYQLNTDGYLHKTITSKIKETKVFADLDFKEVQEVGKPKEQFPTIKNPKKIVIIGDTGCRLKDKGLSGEYQDCSNLKEWPFASVLQQIEKEKADLLIHLGDFHYREQCSNDKNCENYSPVVGYEWKPWELDFFLPMNNIFSKLPLIIVRGNHEDCKRAFLGYRNFLKNEPWNEDCRAIEKTQIIEFPSFTVVNVDSSAVDDKPEFSSEIEKNYITEFERVNKILEEKKLNNVVLVTHKPVYGVAPFLHAFIPTNLNLRKYLERSKLMNKVKIVLGGHVHTSMVIKSAKKPSQIILGNSGTKLDSFKGSLNKAFLKLFNYTSGEFVNSGFGYAIIELLPNKKWLVDFKDADGISLKKVEL